jgi:predicted dithiol-disulfide oxidoreductase (DUF899 family)
MDLAIRNGMTFPHESDEYRSARTALLAEEIELRRHIERVAQMRRALPPGGRVKTSYRFEGENGLAGFEDLFGDKDTLVVYCWMYGPERERPCPMCTSLLSSWDGEAPDIMQRVGLAVVARSPISKLAAFKRERGWRNLPIYSDLTDEFSKDFHSTGSDGKDDNPGFHVFTRRDGTIRHFWSGEMGGVTADPGQDPRGAPDLMPLWTILDATPEGRAPNWYPKLSY